MRTRRLRTAPPPAAAAPNANGAAGSGLRLRLDSAMADGRRLAAPLIPGLGAGEPLKLGRELGLSLPAHEPADLEGREAENAAIVAACRQRLAALDLPVLQQLARIFAGSSAS